MSTGTEIELRAQAATQASLPAKVHYAKALADSGLLPAAYRRQPANVLYAIEYGDMLGLSPMAAITGVHIIEGKPTASAALISALVRRAGHKLRVRGDAKSAWCQIIRCDDPDFPFEVTFTLEDAKTAGLTGKKVWQQYGSSMLKSRAITQCARDACEEALFGLHYTPEELGAEVDEDGVVVGEVVDEPAAQPASAPDGDQWYVHPAPQDEAAGATEDARPWAEIALEQAASFQTDAAGGELFREAAAKARAGECTPGQATHIQNLITIRIAERRKAAAVAILEPLPEGDPWRDKILDGLDSDEEARRELGDVEEFSATGELDVDRARLLARAIIARFPKAAVKDLKAA